jgi:hypothetical protein
MNRLISTNAQFETPVLENFVTCHCDVIFWEEEEEWKKHTKKNNMTAPTQVH